MSVSESSKTVLIDSLSVPKIIGIGPIIMAPPPLTFSPFLVFEMKRKRIAARVTSMPANIKAMPKP